MIRYSTEKLLCTEWFYFPQTFQALLRDKAPYLQQSLYEDNLAAHTHTQSSQSIFMLAVDGH